MATIGPHEMSRDLEKGDEIAWALHLAWENWETKPTRLNRTVMQKAIKALDAYADKMAVKYGIGIKK